MVLGIGGALALARRFELGTAATAVALLPSLAPAYLGWAAFRDDRAESAVVDLDAVADQLARAVQKQWDNEAEIRRVNDPYPLPVAWRAADADLVEPWHALADLARAWPGGPPGDPARWPADATGLAGEDAQIGEVFSQRLPTRRLVVLGEPGAGKTVLLIRLLQDLIERRTGGGLVPVLFSLASWDPTRQRLEKWMAEHLRRSHPGLRVLASAVTTGDEPIDLAQALLDARRVLPILDGFDELPPALYARALDALNRALPLKQPLVLASRAAEYHAVLHQPDTPVRVRLNGAAGIHLLPLTRERAAAYLRRDMGGSPSATAARWNGVTALLGTDAPLARTLSTPLGLFLTRTIYNPRPRPDALRNPAPHPDELCDATAFPTRDAINAHLFNAFIPAAYSSASQYPLRWNARQAHRAFVFLARHLQTDCGGSTDMAWWELDRVFPSYTRPLAFGLPVGLAVGLSIGLSVGLVAGPVAGLTCGLMGGLVGGLTGALRPRLQQSGALSIHLRIPSRSPAFTLAVGFVGALVVGLAVALSIGLVSGPVVVPVVVLTFGLVAGLAFGLRLRLEQSSAPSVRLRLSFRSLAVGLVAGLVAGVVAGLAAGMLGALAGGPHSELVFGLAFGLAGGLTGGLAGGPMTEGHDLGTTVGPAALLELDRRALLVFGLVRGLGGGLTGGLVGAFTFGLTFGLAYCLSFGLTGGLAGAAWTNFVLARVYLAARRRVPWGLMAFLDDAHQHRGVLRQVGSVYQFRHIDLQRHLAQQPWPPPHERRLRS
ncbi:NACHT domain-containing protein [Streptomyces sp. SL13]|uniref:NACHT domain-containing protein n=1 Tax=Streptantibioticus silvisoli TaxID=2705255 RepID=A0AA90K0R9_9ACTN|nr:NACHT domain-containing protein [Streptantibioticus silvisoli]MDI5973271.1 NACHT domain-containing protein [Streptantibioticus silvisoli]